MVLFFEEMYHGWRILDQSINSEKITCVGLNLFASGQSRTILGAIRMLHLLCMDLSGIIWN